MKSSSCGIYFQNQSLEYYTSEADNLVERCAAWVLSSVLDDDDAIAETTSYHPQRSAWFEGRRAHPLLQIKSNQIKQDSLRGKYGNE